MVVVTKRLLQQNIFVLTNICRNKSFVTTSILVHGRGQKVVVLQQQYACRDKYNFVVTKVLLQQAYLCHDKSIVVTNTILLGQKFCCNKHIFVTTKVLS